MKKVETIGSVIADLSRVVQSCTDDAAAAKQKFSELATSDPAIFFAAAIRVAAASSPSPGLRYLVLTLAKDKRLSAGLLDPKICTAQEAIAVTRAATEAGTQIQAAFEMALNKALQAHSSPQNTERILRILEVLASTPGQNCWNSFLVELMAYPDSVVRSKAALLIGRSTRNVPWIARRLLDRDPRVQASAVEALWGLDAAEAKPHLLAALQSTNNRVAANAALGLYLIGDATAPRVLLQMLRHADSRFQLSALWAIGETRDGRFLPVLAEHYQRSEGKLRLAAIAAMSKIRRREKAPQESGQLQIHLSQAAVEAAGRRRLALALSCHPARDLSGIKPTDFALWENGTLIEEYDVQLVRPPALLLAGFVAPWSASGAESYEKSLVEAFTQSLAMKRREDLWRIDRYSTEVNPKTDEKSSSDLTLPYGDALLTPELKASFGCISDPDLLVKAIGLAAHAAPDLIAAIQRQCNAFAKHGGKRHVFFFLHEMSGFDLQQEATIARLGTVTKESSIVLHGICPDVAGKWPLLRELCLSHPEGSFAEPRLDGMVDALVDAYANLSSRFEISYSMPAPREPATVKLRIANRYGEAETSLDLPVQTPQAAPASEPEVPVEAA